VPKPALDLSERATLIGVPASHPTLAAELMLERKGVAFRRIDLVVAVHRPLLRLAGFPGVNVPALVLDGARLQGSRRISRALEVVRPEPALFPAERREEVERAEHWGDVVLQEVPRRLAWWTLRRAPEAVRSFLEGARTGIPPDLAASTARPLILASARLNRATDAAVRRDLGILPALLDRVDELIAEGVIGGDEPNAADFQIFTSVRLLMTFDDLRPDLERRPPGERALRVVPDFPGHVPPVLPAG